GGPRAAPALPPTAVSRSPPHRLGGGPGGGWRDAPPGGNLPRPPRGAVPRRIAGVSPPGAGGAAGAAGIGGDPPVPGPGADSLPQPLPADRRHESLPLWLPRQREMPLYPGPGAPLPGAHLRPAARSHRHPVAGATHSPAGTDSRRGRRRGERQGAPAGDGGPAASA